MNLLKTTLIALAFVAITPITASAQSRPNQNAPIAADVVVSVNGLVCDFCAQAIDRSFRRRAEVNDVRVNLTDHAVTIDFRPNQNLDDATIREIVTRAGYSVVGIRRMGAS